MKFFLKRIDLRNKVLMLFCFFCYNLYSQNRINCEDKIVLSISEIIEYEFHVYSPKLIVKKAFSSLKQVKNLYPEELLQSELSAVNQEWVNFNYGKVHEKSASHFDSVKTLNIDKNFYELICKLQYIYNKEKYAILKFYLVFEGLEEPIGVWRTMKFKEGRWVITSNEFTTDLGMLICSFDSEKLKLLLLNEASNEEQINELKDKIYDNGILNLEKLLKEFNNWIEKGLKREKVFFLDPNRIPLN